MPVRIYHNPRCNTSRKTLALLREKGVRTLCVHGDNPEAMAFVRALREELTRRGLTIRAFA